MGIGLVTFCYLTHTTFYFVCLVVSVICQLEGQLQTLQQTAVQAAEYVKRLEQMNYALSVRVQAMGNSGPSDFISSQRPPDVF